MTRRGSIAFYLPTFVLFLAGCSPPLESGVKVNDHGAISAVSCGRWIEGVSVKDARSGSQLWTAHSSRSPSAHGGDVGSLVMGQVPRGWVENAPPRFSPRPQSWQFVIDLGRDRTIVVSDALLRPGRVFRPGRDRSVSVGHFDDQICNGPLSRTQVAILSIVVLGVSIIYAVRSEVARRRKLRRA